MDEMKFSGSDADLRLQLDRSMKKLDIYPWLIAVSGLVALGAGAWSMLSPQTAGLSGLVLMGGLTALVAIAFFALATQTGADQKAQAAFANAQTGFGRSNEFHLLISVLDEAPDAYLIQTRSGAIVYANNAYHELTSAGNRGRNMGRALPLEQVFSGDETMAAPLYRMARAARSGETLSEDFVIATATGERRLRAEVSPVTNHKNYAVWRISDWTGHTTVPTRTEDSPSPLLLKTSDSVGGQDRSASLPSPEVSELSASAAETGNVVILEPERGSGESLQPVARPSEPIPTYDRNAIFESAPIAIAFLDEAGAVRYGNKLFRNILPSLQPGDRLQDYVAEEYQSDFSDVWKNVAQGQSLKTPVEISFAGDGDGESGSITQLFANRVEESGEDGGAHPVVVYLIDVTQKKSFELQFAQSQKMQAVGQLAGGVAHDFNNLLTAIIGFCDLLLARHGVGDPSFSDIDQIRQNANRAANLVRQLLAFSRQQTLTPKVVQPADLLSDLSNLLQRLLGEKIELDVNLGRDLKSIKVDQSQFDTAVINLAVNARDAMPEGGKLSIRSSMFEKSGAENGKANTLIAPGEYVLIEVEDTGTGIEKEILDKIFEPFFTTKNVGEGTGLGLSTVYGIIKQMDGYIFPDSEVGVGTTFKIYLPVHQGAPETALTEQATTHARDLTGAGTILLVEDEDAVRAFASRALTSRGYTVLEATNGQEALEVLNDEEDIDLIISDVVMPEMDGPTLAKEVMHSHPDTKMIFISGYAEDAFKKSMERPEDISFLPKPFSLKQLASKVKEVLNEGAPERAVG